MARITDFFEMEVAKYRRRIQKIKKKFDPNKPRTNLLLYEMWYDHRVKELRAAEAGEPFVYIMESVFDRFLRAFSGFNVFNHVAAADRTAGPAATRYLELARSYGYPSDTCDRVQAALGLALANEAPPPSLMFAPMNICEPSRCVDINLSRHFGCPVVAIESEEVECSYETLRNVARQLEEAIPFVEEKVPGAKFDEKKLKQLQEIDIEALGYFVKFQKYMKSVPALLAGQDVLRMGHWELREHPRYLEYVRELCDELENKAQRGEEAVPGERLRFMWTVSSTFFYDAFSFLAKHGVSVPIFEASAFDTHHRPSVGNDSEYGRHLGLLEEEARYFNSADSWAGLTERRVSAVIDACREYNIDGLVHFNLPGCHTLCASARIVAERVEKELGIPSGYVEGYCLDSEKFNQAQFEADLKAFIDICLVRKGAA